MIYDVSTTFTNTTSYELQIAVPYKIRSIVSVQHNGSIDLDGGRRNEKKNSEQ